MFDVMYDSEEQSNRETTEGDCFTSYVGSIICFKVRVGLDDEK